jgi:ribonuclease HII
VILPPERGIQERLEAVRDSKQMTARARAYWAEMIREHALAWGVGIATSCEIDTLGIAPAARLAMTRALSECCFAAEHLLIDAFRLPESPLPQTAIIKGDQHSLSIAAASVLAKTTRDALMERLDVEYPGYGFARHKGYGTACHQSALAELGPCAIHRFCYAPIQAAVECTNKKR